MSSGYKNSRKTHIIAVDDSPDNLSLIEYALDDPNYEIDLALSGKEALHKISDHVPDLILLDVMMPEMDGFEVTRRIRQNESYPYIPILLVTAHEQVGASVSYKAGADGVIRKPLDIDELLQQVERLTRPDNTESEFKNPKSK